MTMSRRDPTILFALLVALGAHLALISMGVRAARRDLGWWLQSAPVAVTPRATPIPPDTMQQLGDHDTTGTSINRSTGDVPLESAVADARQEQAIMQRDAVGFGGSRATPQLDQTLRGDSGDNSPRGNSGTQSAATVFGSRESSMADLAPKVSAPVPGKNPAASSAQGKQAEINPLASGPLAPVPLKQASPGQVSDANAPTSDQPADQPTNNQASGASSPAGGAGGRAGADPGAGRPIPTSNFESSAVTHVASRFVAGRVEPQTGRKNLIRKEPDIGPSGVGDLYSMGDTYVVMLLTLDTNGNVIDAKIKRSSGSDSIDLASQRAAYTWWFEPLKDPRTGQVQQEQMEFTIYY